MEPFSGLDLLNYGVLGIISMALSRFAWVAHQDVKKDRDTWRAAYEKERDTRIHDKATADAALETGKTAVELLRAIRSSQERGG